MATLVLSCIPLWRLKGLIEEDIVGQCQFDRNGKLNSSPESTRSFRYYGTIRSCDGETDGQTQRCSLLDDSY